MPDGVRHAFTPLNAGTDPNKVRKADWLNDHLYTRPHLNIKTDYGAKGDGQIVTNGAMTTGTAVLTSASNPFVSTDVGKSISVRNAGGTNTAAPGAATYALAAGTKLGIGAYKYRITFLMPWGETEGGTESTITTTSGNQAVSITAIPLGPAGTIARRIYRTAVGGLTNTEQLVGHIYDNTTTTWTDNSPDSTLNNNPDSNPTVPTVNTTAVPLVTTILSYQSAGQVTLSANASQTVSGKEVIWGTNDTTAINNALSATATVGNPNAVFVPEGVYLIGGAGLTSLRDTLIFGDGKKKSTFMAFDNATSTPVLWIPDPDVRVQDIGFDGHKNPTMLQGIAMTNNNTDKRVVVQDCYFKEFSVYQGRAVYGWTGQNIYVERNEIQNCYIGVLIEDPSDKIVIRQNKIWADRPVTMCFGVDIYSGASRAASVTIEDNFISRANLDPVGNGSYSHGIFVTQVKGIKIINNVCEICHVTLDAPGGPNGVGILAAEGAAGAEIMNNHIRDCCGGIVVEIAPAGDITVGSTGGPRGAIVSGNHIWDGRALFRGGGGVDATYSAATNIIGNTIHDMAEAGIICDSDRVSIQNNIIYNCYKTAAAVQLDKAGIVYYAGVGGLIAGNQCFDNQATKTQKYGIAVADSNHTISHNNVAGNLTAGIFAPTGAATLSLHHNFGFNTESMVTNTADQTNSAAAFVDATGLTASVEANTRYHFRAVLYFQTSATTVGGWFAVNGPAGFTLLKVGVLNPTAASLTAATITSAVGTAYDTGTQVTAGPGATDVMAILEGDINTGATAGTLALRFRSETGTAMILRAGSTFELYFRGWV